MAKTNKCEINLKGGEKAILALQKTLGSYGVDIHKISSLGGINNISVWDRELTIEEKQALYMADNNKFLPIVDIDPVNKFTVICGMDFNFETPSFTEEFIYNVPTLEEW